MSIAGAAVPAPRFDGAAPDDAIVLDAAWQAVAECTGWNARYRDPVLVEYVDEFPGAERQDGRARQVNNVLTQIDLRPGAPRDTLVHEVAHAWVSGRPGTPPTLSEGLTELLVACVDRRHPELELGPRPVVREPVADLTAWTTDTGRPDGYAAPLALAQTAATILGERRLWPDDRTPRTDWMWFWSLLVTSKVSREQGDAVVAALGTDAGDIDLDGDGVSTRDEQLGGTVPWVWDSDEDGFPDGFEHARDGIVVPLDGSAVCTGWRAKEAGAHVVVRVRSPSPPGWSAEVRTSTREADPAHDGSVPVGRSVYVSARPMDGRTLGTLRVDVTGSSLERDPTCRAGRREALPRPAEEEIAALVANAVEATEECLRASMDASTVDVRSVSDQRSAVAAVVAAISPASTTAFGLARSRVLGVCPCLRLGIAPEWPPDPGSHPFSVADVADVAPADESAIEVMAWWLYRLQTRDPEAHWWSAATWSDIDTRLRGYSDDAIFRVMTSSAREPFHSVQSGWTQDAPDLTVLNGGADWQCSGWRSLGNPAFDVADGGLIDLPGWDQEGRVVRGAPLGIAVGRRGGVRDGSGCGAVGGYVWLTASRERAPAPLLKALEQNPLLANRRVVVWLGGPTTGIERGGVLISDDVLAETRRRGAWSELALTIATLGVTASRGR